jgi:hypothetical protein
MRPGKRVDSNTYNKKLGGGGFSSSNNSSTNFPKQWDNTRLTARLQRCILTHDIFHILNWHTPFYTAFVWFSAVSILLGISQFSSIVPYVSCLALGAVLLVGSAKALEVESGPNSVITPSESKVRNKSVVEGNLKTLWARWIEPLVGCGDICTDQQQQQQMTVCCGGLFNDIRVIGSIFIVVTILAELGKKSSEGENNNNNNNSSISICVILAVVISVLFGYNGVKQFGKR